MKSALIGTVIGLSLGWKPIISGSCPMKFVGKTLLPVIKVAIMACKWGLTERDLYHWELHFTESQNTIPFVLINDINIAGISYSVLCYCPLLWATAVLGVRDERRMRVGGSNERASWTGGGKRGKLRAVILLESVYVHAQILQLPMPPCACVGSQTHTRMCTPWQRTQHCKTDRSSLSEYLQTTNIIIYNL